MIYYRIDVLKSLKEQGMNTNTIYKEKLLTNPILQAFREGRVVKADNLSKVCSLLNCTIDELLIYVPDNKPKPELVTLSELRENRKSVNIEETSNNIWEKSIRIDDSCGVCVAGEHDNERYISLVPTKQLCYMADKIRENKGFSPLYSEDTSDGDAWYDFQVQINQGKYFLHGDEIIFTVCHSTQTDNQKVYSIPLSHEKSIDIYFWLSRQLGFLVENLFVGFLAEDLYADRRNSVDEAV